MIEIKIKPALRRIIKEGLKRQRLTRALTKMTSVRSAQEQSILRNFELYDALIRHPDLIVNHTLPDPEWIKDYKKQSIAYRSYLLQAALHGMAVLDGAKQASKNMTDDYGFTFTLGSAEISSIVKKVSSMDLIATLLRSTTLDKAQCDKVLDYAALAEFGPERSKNTMAEVLRNLSVPEQSPFGASGLIRMSDPDLEEKIHTQFNRKSTKQPASVKVSRGKSSFDVKDIMNERRDRIRNKK